MLFFHRQNKDNPHFLIETCLKEKIYYYEINVNSFFGQLAIFASFHRDRVTTFSNHCKNITYVQVSSIKNSLLMLLSAYISSQHWYLSKTPSDGWIVLQTGIFGHRTAIGLKEGKLLSQINCSPPKRWPCLPSCLSWRVSVNTNF